MNFIFCYYVWNFYYIRGIRYVCYFGISCFEFYINVFKNDNLMEVVLVWGRIDLKMLFKGVWIDCNDLDLYNDYNVYKCYVEVSIW